MAMPSDPGSIVVSNAEHTVVDAKVGEAVDVPNRSALLLRRCRRCTISAPGISRNVRIERCEASFVLVGSVETSLDIVQCESLEVLVLSCHTIHINRSTDVTLTYNCQQSSRLRRRPGAQHERGPMEQDAQDELDAAADEASALRLLTTCSSGVCITFEGLTRDGGSAITYHVPNDVQHEAGEGPCSVSKISIDRTHPGAGRCTTQRYNSSARPPGQADPVADGVAWLSEATERGTDLFRGHPGESPAEEMDERCEPPDDQASPTDLLGLIELSQGAKPSDVVIPTASVGLQEGAPKSDVDDFLQLVAPAGMSASAVEQPESGSSPGSQSVRGPVGDLLHLSDDLNDTTVCSGSTDALSLQAAPARQTTDTSTPRSTSPRELVEVSLAPDGSRAGDAENTGARTADTCLPGDTNSDCRQEISRVNALESSEAFDVQEAFTGASDEQVSSSGLCTSPDLSEGAGSPRAWEQGISLEVVSTADWVVASGVADSE